MPISDFWDCELWELAAYINGSYKRQEALTRERWEIARWQSFFGVVPHVDSKKSSIQSPKDLITFPWEESEEKREVTKEEASAIFEKWDKKAATNPKMIEVKQL